MLAEQWFIIPARSGRFAKCRQICCDSVATKDTRIAKAARERPVPTLEQIRGVLAVMPYVTEIERRNRALIAFTLLTGVRDGALASLKLKHVDLAAAKVVQDAREVNTKFSKTFTPRLCASARIYVSSVRRPEVMRTRSAVTPIAQALRSAAAMAPAGRRCLTQSSSGQRPAGSCTRARFAPRRGRNPSEKFKRKLSTQARCSRRSLSGRMSAQSVIVTPQA